MQEVTMSARVAYEMNGKPEFNGGLPHTVWKHKKEQTN